MGEHNSVMTLNVDFGRVAMAGQYAEIGKTSVLCVQSSLRHSCFEKCVSISHFANLLSFAFLENHLKRADKLFCKLEDFDASFGVSITVLLIRYFKFRIKSGGWKRN